MGTPKSLRAARYVLLFLLSPNTLLLMFSGEMNLFNVVNNAPFPTIKPLKAIQPIQLRLSFQTFLMPSLHMSINKSDPEVRCLAPKD